MFSFLDEEIFLLFFFLTLFATEMSSLNFNLDRILSRLADSTGSVLLLISKLSSSWVVSPMEARKKKKTIIFDFIFLLLIVHEVQYLQALFRLSVMSTWFWDSKEEQQKMTHWKKLSKNNFVEDLKNK
jgi:hypothetical protein